MNNSDQKKPKPPIPPKPTSYQPSSQANANKNEKKIESKIKTGIHELKKAKDSDHITQTCCFPIASAFKCKPPPRIPPPKPPKPSQEALERARLKSLEMKAKQNHTALIRDLNKKNEFEDILYADAETTESSTEYKEDDVSSVLLMNPNTNAKEDTTQQVTNRDSKISDMTHITSISDPESSGSYHTAEAAATLVDSFEESSILLTGDWDLTSSATYKGIDSNSVTPLPLIIPRVKTPSKIDSLPQSLDEKMKYFYERLIESEIEETVTNVCGKSNMPNEKPEKPRRTRESPVFITPLSELPRDLFPSPKLQRKGYIGGSKPSSSMSQNVEEKASQTMLTAIVKNPYLDSMPNVYQTLIIKPKSPPPRPPPPNWAKLPKMPDTNKKPPPQRPPRGRRRSKTVEVIYPPMRSHKHRSTTLTVIGNSVPTTESAVDPKSLYTTVNKDKNKDKMADRPLPAPPAPPRCRSRSATSRSTPNIPSSPLRNQEASATSLSSQLPSHYSVPKPSQTSRSETNLGTVDSNNNQDLRQEEVQPPLRHSPCKEECLVETTLPSSYFVYSHSPVLAPADNRISSPEVTDTIPVAKTSRQSSPSRMEEKKLTTSIEVSVSPEKTEARHDIHNETTYGDSASPSDTSATCQSQELPSIHQVEELVISQDGDDEVLDKKISDVLDVIKGNLSECVKIMGEVATPTELPQDQPPTDEQAGLFSQAQAGESELDGVGPDSHLQAEPSSEMQVDSGSLANVNLESPDKLKSGSGDEVESISQLQEEPVMQVQVDSSSQKQMEPSLLGQVISSSQDQAAESVLQDQVESGIQETQVPASEPAQIEEPRQLDENANIAQEVKSQSASPDLTLIRRTSTKRVSRSIFYEDYIETLPAATYKTPPGPTTSTKKPKSWYSENDISGGDLADVESVTGSFPSVKPPVLRSKKQTSKASKERRSSEFYCELEDSDNTSDIVKLSPEPRSNRETPEKSDSPSVTASSYSEMSVSSEESEEEVEMTKEEKQQQKVYFIAREMMTSEEKFVDVLKLLNVDFRAMIEKASQDGLQVIPEEIFNILFSQFPQLQLLNENLLAEFKERIKTWKDHCKISDIIVKVGPFLKLYSSYIKDFDMIYATFDDACKRFPMFRSLVTEFEQSPRCQKLALKHYMLKPIQRIPQYRLLLQQYLDHLESDSPDYEDTKVALEVVSNVADHANDTMKEGDNFQKMLSIQNSLVGRPEIVKPGRAFLKEGDLFKLSRKGEQPRKFILFSDILLYLTPYQGLYKINHILPLTGMKVNVPVQHENEFRIISQTRSIQLAAHSQEEQEAWVKALTQAIEENASKRSTFLKLPQQQQQKEGGSSSIELGAEAPVWIPDQRVTMCQLCTTEFSLAFRRHHCRACGKVVCSICSSKKFPLPYLNMQPARVCDKCFEKLCPDPQTPHHPSMPKPLKKPSVLREVCANDQGSTIHGYLYRLEARRGVWKKLWFVIKDKVLYTYKASEDVAALQSLPLLGFNVVTFTENHLGFDPSLLFQICQAAVVYTFRAPSRENADRWVKAFSEAAILE